MENKDSDRCALFTTSEILEATKGRLISGNLNDTFQAVSIDSRTTKKGDIFVCIKGMNFDGHNFIASALNKGASCVIVAEDKTVLWGDKISPNLICVKDTISALSNLAHYHRKRFDTPIVAVTGSNGKTTTKEMLCSLLSSKYNVLKSEGSQNNIIGLSLTLLRLNSEHNLAVLEFGTNHFGEIKELVYTAAPNVGVITNIGPAHLQFLGDEDGVLKEKWDLIEELSSPRVAIVNGDDIRLKEKLSLNTDETNFFTFGIRNNVDFMAKRIFRKNKKIFFSIKNYPIRLNSASIANVYNALAAYCAARIFSVDACDVIEKFREFQFPHSRFEIKRIAHLNVIDDSYNANYGSFYYAIESLVGMPTRGRKIVVIGDMLELGRTEEVFHRKAGEDLSRARVDLIIAVGRLSHIACDAAKQAGFNPKAIHKCLSKTEVKELIFKVARKDDTILLKGSRVMKLEEIFS